MEPRESSRSHSDCMVKVLNRSEQKSRLSPKELSGLFPVNLSSLQLYIIRLDFFGSEVKAYFHLVIPSILS
jgi:hypothetical protein